MRRSSWGSCEIGSPGCSLTHPVDVALNAMTGIAALLLLVGIMAWVFNNKQAAHTTTLEVRLADARQRRESAGFAARYDSGPE